MAFPSHTDVLIVGAGPAGMACALSLKAQGFRKFVIVDAFVEKSRFSRAVVIHARTLECLDTLGCAQPLIERGKRGSSMGLWIGGSFIRTTSFDALAPYTKFPFALIVPQSTTERVLLGALNDSGIEVHRPYKVLNVQPNGENPAFLDVTFENGEVVQARCVVGADGARSTARRSAGIDFGDPSGRERTEPGLALVNADVVFSTPISLPDTANNFIMSAANFFMITEFPPNSYDHPSDKVFRIATNITPEMGSPPEVIDAPYLQSLVEAYGPGRTLRVSQDPSVTVPVISKVLWAGTFQTRSVVADTFLKRLVNPTAERKGGVVVLVGDAAHIHSPAGGQGMNLGICDAVALGRSLSLAFSSSKPDHLEDAELRTWAERRRKRGLQVVSMTERFVHLASIRDEITWIWGFLPVNLQKFRNFFMKLYAKIPYFRMLAAWQLSGLADRA